MASKSEEIPRNQEALPLGLADLQRICRCRLTLQGIATLNAAEFFRRIGFVQIAQENFRSARFVERMRACLP